VGTQRHTLYLHSSPLQDVTNFGADVLFPVLVREAEPSPFLADLEAALLDHAHAPARPRRPQPTPGDQLSRL
jgi:hypothetical protein